MILYLAMRQDVLDMEQRKLIATASSQLYVDMKNFWDRKGFKKDVPEIPFRDEGGKMGRQYGGPYQIFTTEPVLMDDTTGQKVEVWTEQRLSGSSGDNFNYFWDGGVIKIKPEDSPDIDLLRIHANSRAFWKQRPATFEEVTAGKKIVQYLDSIS